MTAVTFYLNDQRIQPTDDELEWSLLHFVRQQQLTGTKEGCAEGDCGACTVIKAQLNAQQPLQFQAVNACLLPLGKLNGVQIITVESLQHFDPMHPVPQAFVDHHASQCGYCTPGFVMTCLAQFLTQQQQQQQASQSPCVDTQALLQPSDTTTITDLLAGNLCRCTGYGAILTAQTSLSHDQTPHQPTLDWIQRIGDRLAAWHSTPEHTGSHPVQGNWHYPADTQTLCQLLDTHPNATLMAGATDLGVQRNKQTSLPATPMIALTQIHALQQLTWYANRVIIGANVTYSQFMTGAQQHFPELAEYLRWHSSPPIRHMGTLVGNVANASPIGDMAPVLIACRAHLLLKSIHGERRIPIEDYFIAYGQQDRRANEYIHHIELPLPNDDTIFAAYKVSKRRQQDISAISMAFALQRSKGRVQQLHLGVGGMADRSIHVDLSPTLKGKPWDDDALALIQAILAQQFQPLSDHRASATYRQQLVQNLCLKFYAHTHSTGVPHD